MATAGSEGADAARVGRDIPDDQDLVSAISETLAAAGCDGHVVGVAVSGGGDSVALLRLAHRWAAVSGRRILAVTVDHGLREASKAEARFVADTCDALGITHDILCWETPPDPTTGNLQDAARAARRRLIGEWARCRGASSVLLGHTEDDQAETFLMRLARGSGVDGLACMETVTSGDGFDWIRPLLGVSRSRLRRFLETAGSGWCEDPSNDDDRFLRTRVRKARSRLEDLGLSAATLAATAGRMQRARAGLEAAVLELAKRVAEPTAAGSVRIALADVSEAPEEIRYRLLSHALMWVSGVRYRPRFDALLRLETAIWAGRPATLSGCHVVLDSPGFIEVCRETAAMTDLPAPPVYGVFDRRWRVRVPPGQDGVIIRPLGEPGLALCPGWRDRSLSRTALRATPSFWKSGRLISAPLAGMESGYGCRLAEGAESFFRSIGDR